MNGFWCRGGMNKYHFRNEILRSLGYSEPVYKNYLKSDEWKSIRSSVLLQWPLCVACESPATQVHHMAYDIGTLLGLHHSSLAPVCRTCHEDCEFTGDDKNDLSTASQRIEKSARLSEYGKRWLKACHSEWASKCISMGLKKRIKAMEREIRELANCADKEKILSRNYCANVSK